MVETATEEKVPLEAKNKPFMVCGFLGVFWNLSYGPEDHLGSTRMVLDEDGTVKEALMYQPYGTVSDVQGITVAGTDPLRQKFTTKEFDEEGDENGAPGIKAYYFGARMYDPDLGMWWSTDPKEQFFSSYAYTINPLLFIDPNGQNFVGALFRQIAIGAAQGAGSYIVRNACKFESSMGIEEAIDWWAGLGASTIGGAVSGGLGFTSQYLLSNVIPTIRNAAGAYIVNSLLEIGMKSGSAMVTSALTQSLFGEVDKRQVLINGIAAGGTAFVDILLNGSLVNAQSLVSKEKKADMVGDFHTAEQHWVGGHYNGDYSERYTEVRMGGLRTLSKRLFEGGSAQLGLTRGNRDSWIKFTDWRGTAGHERFHQIMHSLDYDAERKLDLFVPRTDINAPKVEQYFK